MACEDDVVVRLVAAVDVAEEVAVVVLVVVALEVVVDPLPLTITVPFMYVWMLQW